MKHNVEAFKKYYINATKEEVIEDMFLDNCNLQKEIERLNNIIKEVREYLDTLEKQHAYKFVEVDNHIEMRIDENEYLVWCKYNKLLNILDKGE